MWIGVRIRVSFGIMVMIRFRVSIIVRIRVSIMVRIRVRDPRWIASSAHRFAFFFFGFHKFENLRNNIFRQALRT